LIGGNIKSGFFYLAMSYLLIILGETEKLPRKEFTWAVWIVSI
jgi:hypothetical protein